MFSISSTTAALGMGFSLRSGANTAGWGARSISVASAAAKSSRSSSAGPINAARSSSGEHPWPIFCMASQSGPAWRQMPPAKPIIARKSFSERPACDRLAPGRDSPGDASAASSQSLRPIRSTTSGSSSIAPRNCCLMASASIPNAGQSTSISGLMAERGICTPVWRHAASFVRAPESGKSKSRFRLAGLGGCKSLSRGSDGPRRRWWISALARRSTKDTILSSFLSGAAASTSPMPPKACSIPLEPVCWTVPAIDPMTSGLRASSLTLVASLARLAFVLSLMRGAVSSRPESRIGRT